MRCDKTICFSFLLLLVAIGCVLGGAILNDTEHKTIEYILFGLACIFALGFVVGLFISNRKRHLGDNPDLYV